MVGMLTIVTDPVSGCALANDVTSWVGLPADALTCATCGGLSGSHRLRPIEEDYFECRGFGDCCDACNCTGSVVVPEGRFPALIATTDAPVRLGLFGNDAWNVYAANDPMPALNLTNGTMHAPIHPASVLGTATLELLPHVGATEPYNGGDHIRTKLGGGLSLERSIGIVNKVHIYQGDDIDAALPFGDWGGYGLRLIDFTASIECPTCGGLGGWGVEQSHSGGDIAEVPVQCPDCRGDGGLACPLSWGAAPDRPCITQLDLKELPT